MTLERDDYYRDLKYLQDECKRCMSYHVILKMTDGSVFDGIIEDVDDNRIIVLVGEDIIEQEGENQPDMQMKRQPYSYGSPRRRFRRFRRRNFPLNLLATLALVHYPYAAPLYPYYYNY
ncbi:hypothetical protein [Clostridium sp.]|uniref:hypothetical protein n=1 Tax=Clostridium sp. TaxID=1506 RepID=UPI0026341E58|nr:hypothetical protein [Clostridium sp.]